MLEVAEADLELGLVRIPVERDGADLLLAAIDAAGHALRYTGHHIAVEIDWIRFMLQFQYVDVNRLNSAGKVQIGQKFETLALRAQAAW